MSLNNAKCCYAIMKYVRNSGIFILSCLIICHSTPLKNALKSSIFTFVSAQIEMVPQNYQKLENEDQVKLMEKLIDIMEDDDDVQNIWHNWEE